MAVPQSRAPAGAGYARSRARCRDRRGPRGRNRSPARRTRPPAMITRRGPGDRPLAHVSARSTASPRRSRELPHRRDSVGEPGAPEPLADERALMGMQVDEPRYDGGVARVDDFADRRQHAAPDDCRDAPAAYVQIDVAVIGAADAVEEAADLDDVVGAAAPAPASGRCGRAAARRPRPEAAACRDRR